MASVMPTIQLPSQLTPVPELLGDIELVQGCTQHCSGWDLNAWYTDCITLTTQPHTAICWPLTVHAIAYTSGNAMPMLITATNNAKVYAVPAIEWVRFNINIETCHFRVSPVSHLHWYWQPNKNNQQTKGFKTQNNQTQSKSKTYLV